MHTNARHPDKGVTTAKERAAAAADVERRRQQLLKLFSNAEENGGTPGPGLGAVASTKREGIKPRSKRMSNGNVKAGPSQRRAGAAGSEDGAKNGRGGSISISQLNMGAFVRRNTVAFTKEGRPVILSPNSRRLPDAFAEQQQVDHLIENSISNVNDTLRQLTYDLSRAADIQLPPATAAVVEDNHRIFTDQLALRSGAEHGMPGTGESAGSVPGHGLFLPYRLCAKKLTSDWLTKVQRARAAAADESLGDMQSVVDYAGDAEVSRLNKDRSIADELSAIRESLDKIEECAAAMRVDVSGNLADGFVPGSASDPHRQGCDTESSSETPLGSLSLSEGSSTGVKGVTVLPARNAGSAGGAAVAAVPYAHSGVSAVPWWASALRTRDLKAHAIRLNYHARRSLQWDWRCREHVLLQAAFLNHSSIKYHEDLVRLQGQLASFTQRFNDSEASMQGLQREAEELQQELAEAGNGRQKLQEELVALAHADNLLAEDDAEPLSAELVLLLTKHAWPKHLDDDLSRILQWMKTEQVSLE